MKLKFAKAALMLVMLFAGTSLFSQQLIQEVRSTSVQLLDDGKGVASATVEIKYNVWADMKNSQVLVFITYSNIRINPDAGYYYQGKLYRSEVPGLKELLSKIKPELPRVNFELYYGAAKQVSFTREIMSHNDLSMLTGDNPHKLTVSKDMLEHPDWRLVGTSMVTFSNLDWWEIEARIEKYESDRKEEDSYRDMIRDADAFMNTKEYEKALAKYGDASRSRLADNYPKEQMARIRELVKKNESEKNFKNIMDAGWQAERNKDYNKALAQYELAASMGVDDDKASRYANNVKSRMEDLKKAQQEELEKKQKEQDEKDREALDKIKRDKEIADKAIQDNQLEIERKNEEEAAALKKKMDDEQQQKLDQDRRDMEAKEAEARRKADQEAREKKEKKEAEKKKFDDGLIARYEQDMQFDPVKFYELTAKADSFYNAGFAIHPYEALELKAAWWDNNYYMTDFREDLNEPRRREAWQQSQQLLQQVRMQFEIAKYTYMEAIKYTDRDSYEHHYLLGRIKSMDLFVAMQETSLEASKEQEEMRQKNFEEGRIYAKLNRLNDNRLRSEIAYQYMVSDYLYPRVGTKVEGSENALEKRADFERRLNEADQQLAQDNLVTGVTSQIALNAITDDSKQAQEMGNHSMGLNLFVSTGYASFPVISNMTVKDGYIPESRTGTLVVAPFQGGFDWWIHRSKNFDIALTGDATVGVLPIRGYQNFFLGTGASFKFNVGIRAVKLALEADWEHRQGSYQYDQDVALADPNNPWQVPTEQVYTADISYNVRKVGAGLHFSFAKYQQDGYLRLMYYAEQPSFYQGFDWKQPVWSGAAELVFRGGITLRFAYSKNYPMAGATAYMMRSYTDRDYWRFSFGKTWTIGKTK